LVYELDDNLLPLRHYYLADEETVKKATERVISQIKENPK
jgi:2,3-bisphosphoglycerate-dependent phosphoglycerate mutase